MGVALPPPPTPPLALAPMPGPGKSQKEDQESHGEIEEIGGRPSVADLRHPGPPGLPSSSSLGSLELPQTSFRKALSRLTCCFRPYEPRSATSALLSPTVQACLGFVLRTPVLYRFSRRCPGKRPYGITQRVPCLRAVPLWLARRV